MNQAMGGNPHNEPVHSAYLVLGTNLGNRAENLERALTRIREVAGKISQRSSIYETAAWGMENGYSFYNMAVHLQTPMPPDLLMVELLRIEAFMGRIRTGLVENRIIDIDIAFYDQLILNTQLLTIPHPRVHQRKFALLPLNEIAADLVHPVFNKTINTLLHETPDQSEVTILDFQ